MIDRPLPSLACTLLIGLLAAGFQSSTHRPAHAESPATWSEFHGFRGHGVSGGNLPSTWSDSDYVWRRKLGSQDVGSPVVSGNSVYYLVSKPDAEKVAIESVNLINGKLRWSKEFAQRNHHLHSRNTFASSTPAADDRNVFAAWSDPDHTYLKCFDHDGTEVWSRDFGSWQSQHGFGTSPKIFGSTVLLFNSQQADQLKPGETAGHSRMIAVDRESGETIWETPLDTTRSCYGVPAIYTDADGAAQVVDANTGNGMFGLDANTGKMLWSLPVFEMRCCSTPLIIGDIAVASSGSGGGGNHLVAVRIPQSAGEQPKQLYRLENKDAAPYVPTPVLKDGRLFMIGDKGIAACVDAQTGDILWKERIGGNFGASPIMVGDKLLLISLDGEATVLRASDTFEEIGRVDLGGSVGATPAYSQGRLLLRVGDELRCLTQQI
jgi:outer membrane protein assembly factor BamB